MSEENKELELKKNTEVSTEVNFFDSSELGNGFEETTVNDLQPTFLKIAQKENADPDEAAYIEGLSVGDFFDTTEKSNLGNPLEAVVLHFNTSYVEWGKDLGDFRRQYTAEEFRNLKGLKDHDSKIGTKITPEGTSIVETKNYFLYLPKFPEKGIVMYCLSVTGAKLSKMWESRFSLIQRIGKQAPRFASVWKIGSMVAKSSKHQKSWRAIGCGESKKLNVEFQGFVPAEHQATVITLRRQIKKWIDAGVKIDYSKDKTSESSEFSEEYQDLEDSI